MGLFGGKNYLVKVDPPRIRIEKVFDSRTAAGRPPIPVRPPAPRRGAAPASAVSPSSKSAGSRKRPAPTPAAAPARRSPVASDKVASSDSEDDWAVALEARSKRRRRDAAPRHVDEKRVVTDPAAFAPTPPPGPDSSSAIDPSPASFIHAADVALPASGCLPALGASAADVEFELQYPSLMPRERYKLVVGKDTIDAVVASIQVVRHVANHYLAEPDAAPFLSANGIVRQLEKASNRNVQDPTAFRAALADYNDRLATLVRDGTVVRLLDARHDVPRDLAGLVLDQVYDRTVAPRVELLSKYQNGSDNVYGELLHAFVSDVLVDRLQMTSDQVLVDLGSGVGNVVLQAALEIGCSSHGCEMMENACNLADDQLREFTTRCRLWGIAPGQVSLERGDFRTNDRIHQVLERADVVLVNNQAFTSQLNDDLVHMFLDLKTGCKVVSLKSFVHDHKGAYHNINDVGSTILQVEELTYPEGYVSWTNAGGTYFISTKK